jgi:hypothetical protein
MNGLNAFLIFIGLWHIHVRITPLANMTIYIVLLLIIRRATFP